MIQRIFSSRAITDFCIPGMPQYNTPVITCVANWWLPPSLIINKLPNVVLQYKLMQPNIKVSIRSEKMQFKYNCSKLQFIHQHSQLTNEKVMINHGLMNEKANIISLSGICIIQGFSEWGAPHYHIAKNCLCWLNDCQLNLCMDIFGFCAQNPLAIYV